MVDGVLGGVGALARVEEAELVEQLGPAEGVEVGDQVGREGGGLAEERVAHLRGDDEAVLLDAGDAGGLLDGRRGEAVPRATGSSRRGGSADGEAPPRAAARASPCVRSCWPRLPLPLLRAARSSSGFCAPPEAPAAARHARRSAPQCPRPREGARARGTRGPREGGKRAPQGPREEAAPASPPHRRALARVRGREGGLASGTGGGVRSGDKVTEGYFGLFAIRFNGSVRKS